MKITKLLFIYAVSAVLMTACSGGQGTGSAKTSGGFSYSGEVTTPAKYVFFFIGDGMAAPQVRLAEAALISEKFQENYMTLTGSENPIEKLHISEMGITGLATTNAQNRYITCSAAAATALATGSKTDIGIISQSPSGEPLLSIAYMAQRRGMKVGIVSSVSIDHATPACFYANASSRSKYTEISDQLLTSGFQYFGGGSVKWDSRARSLGVDKAEAYRLYRESAAERGYTYVTSRSEFDALHGGDSLKVIATLNMLSEEQYSDDGAALPYTIDLGRVESADNRISLADFTKKGIEVLEGDSGFFMMVEGGKIDWACHANDAATVAYEVVAFDEAVGVALEFAKAHPSETLIVITGDHDCGGLALGFAGTSYESAFENLSGSSVSYDVFAREAVEKMRGGAGFAELMAFACQKFGFTNAVKGDNATALSMTLELSDYEVSLLEGAYHKSIGKIEKVGFSEADEYSASYGGYDPFTTTCTHLLNNKSGVDFTSYSHTAVPVMVFASGANASLFSGYYDNTDIAKKIAEAAGL